jgi:ubiquinone/menaquinone biosynthesis C-methylase UbiE
MITYLLVTFIIILSLIIVYLIWKLSFLKEQQSELQKTQASLDAHLSNLKPDDVRGFYNEYTEKFLKVYGDIIQAFRTKNVNDYLDYTIKSAGLEAGQSILDAGCGVAGPATYFAEKLNINIECCTISDVQEKMAQENIAAKNLSEKVRVIRADYHQIDQLYPQNKFDRVIFLESFGHSPDKSRLIDAAWNVLKPGGFLYIKDLFEREAGGDEDMRRIKEICLEINKGYQYAIADLHVIISLIRKKGFILNFVKTPEVELSLFEHLTISNDFQNLFDVSKINSWENYVFPIDFFEIKCQKPAFMLDMNKHLYHMNQPELENK